MFLKSILIIVQICYSIVNADNERIQVRLSGGLIEGKKVKFGDQEAIAFMGVPYAEPPIGDLRFRPTRLKSSWEGVWDVTKYGPPCAQRTLETVQPLANSSEDCLHINIFADSRCFNKSCPIFFYVHGGGFYFDASTMFNETTLMKNFAIHETIIVVPAYRLGIFGFLDAGGDGKETPYNAAILDLITALRWSQLELPRIGGDIRRMTIIGNSAGAHMALILVNSPLVEESAFQSAIISSGMLRIHESSNEKHTQLALQTLECIENKTFVSLTHDQKMKCLHEKSTDELLDAMSDTEKNWIEINPQPDNHALISKNVAEFLESWRGIPLILITTKDEFYLNIWPTIEGKCKYLVENFGYNNPKTIEACIDYYKTVSHLNHTVRDAYHSFMHEFASINTKLGFPTFTALFAQDHGKRHAGDLKYLLDLHPIEEKDVDDLQMDYFYPMILREFVKNGPNGMKDWLPTDEYGRNYYWMNFKTDNSKLVDWPHMIQGELFQPNETNFWRETLRKIDNDLEIETIEEEADDKSIWIAFWSVLTICAVLTVALSSIIVYWISVRIKVLDLSKKVDVY